MASTGRVARDQVAGLRVEDLMIRSPRTLPGDATVADVRRAFQRASQRTVLLADEGRFRGALERDSLPAGADGDEPAERYADPHPATVTPATDVERAIELLDDRSEPRLVVLDEDGVRLVGLLCFNEGSQGFCVEGRA